jgi:hypothetical protein
MAICVAPMTLTSSVCNGIACFTCSDLHRARRVNAEQSLAHVPVQVQSLATTTNVMGPRRHRHLVLNQHSMDTP